MLKSAEEREERKIAVDISIHERRQALEICKAFGYTLENSEGLDEIQPRILGLKGASIDIERALAGHSTAHTNSSEKKRVDLSAARGAQETYLAPTEARTDPAPEDFLRLEAGEGEDYEATNYNHRLRRKVRRAVEAAEMQKEEKVRDRLRTYCQEGGFEVPIELNTPLAPVHGTGQRTMDNGTLETAKAERVRKRLELAEFNAATKVLRKQAKELATEAGLRIFAELTGQIPKANADGKGRPKNYGPGWHITEGPPPEDDLKPEELELL